MTQIYSVIAPEVRNESHRAEIKVWAGLVRGKSVSCHFQLRKLPACLGHIIPISASIITLPSLLLSNLPLPLLLFVGDFLIKKKKLYLRD